MLNDRIRLQAKGRRRNDLLGSSGSKEAPAYAASPNCAMQAPAYDETALEYKQSSLKSKPRHRVRSSSNDELSRISSDHTSETVDSLLESSKSSFSSESPYTASTSSNSHSHDTSQGELETSRNIKRIRSVGNFAKWQNGENIWERYCRILPRAKYDMELKLSGFLEKFNKYTLRDMGLHPCENFSALQILEIARSTFVKSLSNCNSFDSNYFKSLSDTIEELLSETAGKCPEKINMLYDMAQKFDLIVSDVTRILCCIENDPSHILDKRTYTDERDNILNREMNLIAYIRKAMGHSHLPTASSVDYPGMFVTNQSLLPSMAIKRNKFWLPPPADATEVGAKNPKPHQSQYLSPKDTDFNVCKLISHGAFGSVFLVKHYTTGRYYAMKKILKGHALLKNQVRQIFAERDILSFVENPFVISMLCSFETKNSYCMVMEFAEGGDCASLLKTMVTFPIEIARVYVAETITAVEYIHNYGIIHRDVKPDNLLITATGHIKLTDFGLSKMGLVNMTALHSKDYLEVFQDKSIQGTPDYIAPEVILNRPYGRNVDYWSIGIVFYEFLIGCTPFYGNTVDELFESIVSSTIEWPTGAEAISPDAQSLILNLLQRDPRLRYEAAQAKAHPFFSDLEWDQLLQIKTEHIPSISNEEDTSNFDTRMDRYNHPILSADDSDCNTFSDSFSALTKRFKDEMCEVLLSPKNNVPPSENHHYKRIRSDVNADPPLLRSSSHLSNGVSQRKFYATAKPAFVAPSRYAKMKEAIGSIEFYGWKKASPVGESNPIPANLTVTLQRNSSNPTFGFAIRTIRVHINKKTSFLLHIVDSVRKNSQAEDAGLRQGHIITMINCKNLYGLQHVDVVRMLPHSTKILTLTLCSFEKFGIVQKRKDIPVYYINPYSPYYQELIDLRIAFDTAEDNSRKRNRFLPTTSQVEPIQPYQVSKTSECRSPKRLLKKSPSIFKKLMRKLLNRKTMFGKREAINTTAGGESDQLRSRDKNQSRNVSFSNSDVCIHTRAGRGLGNTLNFASAEGSKKSENRL